MKDSNKLKDYAKQLRSNQTNAEERLWYYLRANRLAGIKFKRQYVICDFIVDFYCVKAKIVIEIDGDEHYTNEHQQYDKRRSELLTSKGITVLRYSNREVMCEINSVLENILRNIKKSDASPLS